MHGRYTLQAEPLQEGDAGTAQTIARIRELVEQGKRDPVVNRMAGEILRRAGVRGYDYRGEVRALFTWVLRNIRFTRDPEGKEVLRPARTTLEWGFGDCDDINAILLPALFATVGHTVRLVTIASQLAAPEQFSHVYCEVQINGRWIPVDAARKDTKFATAPSQHFRKRVWSLSSDTFQDVRGLGCGCGMKRRTQLGNGTHLRMTGLGASRYVRASALGDFNWAGFTSLADSIGKSTASIVTAARIPTAVFPSAAGYPSPYGLPGGVPPGGGVSAVGSVGSGTLIIGGIAAAVLLLVLSRGRS